MKIISIPISKIQAAAYNPRKDLQPLDPEYAQIKRSIEEFDLVEPLVWNERTGNLVSGHQRLKVLKNERGITEVDVSVVNLDDAKEKALNIALNKITGAWDIPQLKDLLVSLDDGSIDTTLTGFEEGEVKALVDFEGSSDPGISGGKIVECPHCSGEFRMKRGKVVALRGPSHEKLQEALA